jgi:hypothetical protein
VKAHVELTCFLDTTDLVSKGELDRLVETFKVYLESVKGLPEMSYIINGNVACITAYSSPGKSQGLVTKTLYIRKTILDCLEESGMILGDILQ